MESNRAKHSLKEPLSRRRQAGITFIGLLLLVIVFGSIGFAVLRIVPLYLERMKIGTVLSDIQTELGQGGNTITGIRSALDSRLYIENVRTEPGEVEVAREGDGYVIRIDKELRAPFVADLSFVLEVQDEVPIAR